MVKFAPGHCVAEINSLLIVLGNMAVGISPESSNKDSEFYTKFLGRAEWFFHIVASAAKKIKAPYVGAAGMHQRLTDLQTLVTEGNVVTVPDMNVFRAFKWLMSDVEKTQAIA